MGVPQGPSLIKTVSESIASGVSISWIFILIGNKQVSGNRTEKETLQISYSCVNVLKTVGNLPDLFIRHLFVYWFIVTSVLHRKEELHIGTTWGILKEKKVTSCPPWQFHHALMNLKLLYWSYSTEFNCDSII